MQRRLSCIWGRPRAFTLIESMMASTILAAAVVVIGGMVTAAMQQSRTLQQQSTALPLAKQLLEEISAKPLADPEGVVGLGPDSGEVTRELFDNIDDYHGYIDTSTAMVTSEGGSVELDATAPFTRSVSVQYRNDPTTAPVGTLSSGAFALVTVSVSPTAGKAVTVSRLFSQVNWRTQ